MPITKKTHYNPCFWIAYWSSGYRSSRAAGIDLDPRKQIVSVLNLSADKVLQFSTEGVHWLKGQGLAEITPEDLRDYLRKNAPERLPEVADFQGSYYVDFENHFSALEQTPIYDRLLDVVQSGELKDAEDKAFIATFIILQRLRSPASWRSLEEVGNLLGEPKFRMLQAVKKMLSDGSMASPIFQLFDAQWIIYILKNHTFPLSDSVALQKRNFRAGMMVPLSPRILVEINFGVTGQSGRWLTKCHLSRSKYAEFRRLSIEHSFREILFSDPDVLESWRHSKEYQARLKQLEAMDSFNASLKTPDGREILIMNAHSGPVERKVREVMETLVETASRPDEPHSFSNE